jgi:hypothetical protein
VVFILQGDEGSEGKGREGKEWKGKERKGKDTITTVEESLVSLCI